MTFRNFPASSATTNEILSRAIFRRCRASYPSQSWCCFVSSRSGGQPYLTSHEHNFSNQILWIKVKARSSIVDQLWLITSHFDKSSLQRTYTVVWAPLIQHIDSIDEMKANTPDLSCLKCKIKCCRTNWSFERLGKCSPKQNNWRKKARR